jgi:hypothetical protein
MKPWRSQLFFSSPPDFLLCIFYLHFYNPWPSNVLMCPSQRFTDKIKTLQRGNRLHTREACTPYDKKALFFFTVNKYNSS